ncbi:/ copA / putative copper-importing P-type ATPase A /:305246 Forward [Candidatus Hepatoplasma crinochetorum]|uniref:/ copA / putative copper-importing P-type ATPase A /:305246 Forward n=1 Tax=Candidatus Hepatoplasma crinochetorum TaxID=295596 RepID=A0A0G7ZMN8_9MOLU|nr:/ copA / putative copper-importing P-type ATPase A /:305246 Forward [Candidatus Hepatoplasma crinochetorum]
MENIKKEKKKKIISFDILKFHLFKLIIGIIFLIIFFWTEFFVVFYPDSNLLPDIFVNIWWQFSLSTIILILISYEYLVNSIKDIFKKIISDDLLVTISAFTSYIFSICAIGINFNELKANDWLITNINGTSDTLFILFAAFVEVSVIIYIGRMIEFYVTEKTIHEITAINDLFVDEAVILRNNKEERIATVDLKVNDIIICYPGETIPVDGMVLEGEALINEASFTGETNLVKKRKNSDVYGGTISNQYLKIKVKYRLEDSLINKIHQGILKAKEAKSDYQKIADKVVIFLVPVVLVLGFLALTFWSIFSGWQDGLLVMVTVFVVACPCSFAMITPLSILVANGVALKKEIIFNSKRPFEKKEVIDTIAFDKTGTITTGKLAVKKTNLSTKYLNLIYSMELYSNHPIAKSIVLNYQNQFKDRLNLKTQNVVGNGLKAKYEDQTYYLGSWNFAKNILTRVDQKVFVSSNELIIYLFTKEKIIGYLELEDEIREDAYNVINSLKKKNIAIYMITGDQKKVAYKIARKVGILEENVFYQTLPSEKAEIVEKLKKEGHTVGFVGDGINDSIALETSNLGISLGSGSALALQSSDITIRNDDLKLINEALDISSKTLKTIYIGLIVASIYNLILIPLALSGILVPSIGAIAMAINDTMAVIIAASLKRLSFKKKNKDKENL